ncbi:MAG TPA: hypothetical protein VGJ13_00385 [Pseudonocardiaceae bacterium]
MRTIRLAGLDSAQRAAHADLLGPARLPGEPATGRRPSRCGGPTVADSVCTAGWQNIAAVTLLRGQPCDPRLSG